jgi:hypothetical protein
MDKAKEFQELLDFPVLSGKIEEVKEPTIKLLMYSYNKDKDIIWNIQN